MPYHVGPAAAGSYPQEEEQDPEVFADPQTPSFLDTNFFLSKAGPGAYRPMF
jgi:hypothetical protein